MRRAVDLIPSRTVYRYVVARGIVYRLQPVNTLLLSEHGWASLEGSAELRKLRKDHEEESRRLQMVGDGIPAEDAKALIARQTETELRQREEELEMVLSTPQGRRDYEARRKAYVCAAMCGLGVIDPSGSWDVEAYGPVERFLGLMPSDWSPEEGMCVDLNAGDGEAMLIDPDARILPTYDLRKGESQVDAVNRVQEAGHLAYGAHLDQSERQAIFLAVKAMANGRARRVAGFRVGGPGPEGARPQDVPGLREVADGGPGPTS